MSEAAIGAMVRYCGHNGTFVADIFRIAGVNVIRANGPVTMKTLTRPAKAPTHQLEDFPQAGFWRPDLGVFVVPEAQVTKL